jgi:hypothetical protein
MRIRCVINEAATWDLATPNHQRNNSSSRPVNHKLLTSGEAGETITVKHRPDHTILVVCVKRLEEEGMEEGGD